MINYYREKFYAYVNDEDIEVNNYIFSSIDMVTVVEIIIAAILLIVAKVFVNQPVVAYIMYILSFLVFSRDIIFRFVSKILAKIYFSRELFIFVACFLMLLCGQPLLSIFSIWLYRLGDIIISVITADTLKKCGYPGVESIGYKLKKYRPKSFLENKIIYVYKVLPLFALGASALIGLISLLSGDFEWTYFLNFASVAIVVSTSVIFPLILPLVYRVFAFFNKRQGVKIGGFITFTALKELKSLVLNKTGILIKDEYVIYSVDSIDFSEDDILEMAAYAEYNSSHPIADAILRRYNAPINASLISNFEEKLGGGVKAVLGDSTILVGSERFMVKNDVVISKKISNAVNDRLMIFVAMNGEEVGCIQLAYKRLKKSKDLIELMKKNANVSLLTAADTKLASDICEYFEINDYHAECTDSKSEQLVNVKHDEINENGSVAFVTNDVKRVHLAEMCDVSVLIGASEFSAEERNRFDVLVDDDGGDALYKFFDSVFMVKRTWTFMYALDLILKVILLVLAVASVVDVFWAILINLLGSFVMLFCVSRLAGKRQKGNTLEKK